MAGSSARSSMIGKTHPPRRTLGFSGPVSAYRIFMDGSAKTRDRSSGDGRKRASTIPTTAHDLKVPMLMFDHRPSESVEDQRLEVRLVVKIEHVEDRSGELIE